MLKAFDQGRVFGVAHGSAPFRVLALPGWMHTAADFDAVFSQLSVGALALDLPGFGGGTPEPLSATGAAGYAAVVAPVLEADLTAPVVLLGHSFGGRVAVHLAATHPERVAAVVLSGVPGLCRREGPAARPPLGYRLARALNRKGVVSDARMEARRRRSGSVDYRNAPSPLMRDVLVKVTNEHYEEQLRAIRCPVELVWGEADDAAPLAMARRAATMLRDGATLTTLPGVGHFTPTAAPEALAAAVARHLPA